MISLVLILPATEQANGNAIAIALGHDVAPGSTYRVPLSGTGHAPATHYGCRTWATPGFVAMLQAAKSGEVSGLSTELAALAMGVRVQYPATIAALIADARETDEPFAHWADVLGANNLSLAV